MAKVSFDFIDSPVFILGHPKAGTSLLTALLDSHPQLMVLTEESDFYSITNKQIEFVNRDKSRAEEEKKIFLLKKILEDTQLRNLFRGRIEKDISGNFDYSSFKTKLFQSIIADSISAEFVDRCLLLKTIIKAFSVCAYEEKQKGGFKYWIEKTPRHIHHLKHIQNDFPQAKFIFIYRDPRDNYISYSKKTGNKCTAAAFSFSWNNCFKHAEGIDKKQILFVKYEELITNPSKIIDGIVAFLSITKTDDLFRPTKLGLTWKGNSMFGESRDKIDSSKIYRYQTMISSKDWFIIEVLCKDKMKKYQYSPDNRISLKMVFEAYKDSIMFFVNKFFTLSMKKMRCYLIEIDKHCMISIKNKHQNIS